MGVNYQPTLMHRTKALTPLKGVLKRVLTSLAVYRYQKKSKKHTAGIEHST